MARAQQEIRTAILAEKNASAELNGLRSASATAIYTLWVNVFAYFTSLLEQAWDAYAAKVANDIATQKNFKTTWYAKEALKFQDGDLLSETTYEYPATDPSKQIIKRASVTELTNGVISIKVAKGEPLTALSAPELARFTAYMGDKKPAGILLNIISLNADVLSLNATVWYDAQLGEGTTKTSVENAIREYIKNIDFGGRFVANDLIEQVRNLPGVRNMKITLLQATAGGVFTIDQTYDPIAGYLSYDSAGSNLTMTAE